MADEKDPMACLDMQNYLHTESDCLEMSQTPVMLYA